MPENPVVFFSFLLHFMWEFVQAPAFAGMTEADHWEGIRLCLSAAIGDVGFALTAFWTASIVARSRSWILHPRRAPATVFVAVEIALTLGFEYYYTNITLRGTHSELMPLVPPFGTGLSPLMQWLVIPPLVVWLARRHLLGAKAIREGPAAGARSCG